MEFKKWLNKNIVRFFGAKLFGKMYLQSEKSKTSAKFCEKVYGRNFCQANMLDEEQLQKLLSLLDNGQDKEILDLGCGIGYLTEFIASETKANIIGVDFAKSAIDSAQSRTSHVKNVNFNVGNINELTLNKDPFDFIIAIDILYFVKDLNKTLRDAKSILNKNGKILAFYTSKLQRGVDESPESTELGKALLEEGMSFQSWNFSKNEDRIWEETLLQAEELKDQWIAEGNIDIYKSRIAEAKNNLNARKKATVTRYLYSI